MGDSVLTEWEKRELAQVEAGLRAQDRRLDDMLRLFVCDGWVRRLRWAMTGRRRAAHRSAQPGVGPDFRGRALP